MAHQFELVAASVLSECFLYFLKGFTLFADPFFKITTQKPSKAKQKPGFREEPSNLAYPYFAIFLIN